MTKNIFSQRTERFFPTGLIFGGILMILIGTGVLIVKPAIGLLILLAGVSIVFLHYGVLIDIQAKVYKEYWGLLGLKFGKWQELPPIEYLSVTKSRFTQQIGLRAANTTLKGVIYRGNLRINEHDRILLMQSTEKEKVLTELQNLARELDVKLLDSTEAERIWVQL